MAGWQDTHGVAAKLHPAPALPPGSAGTTPRRAWPARFTQARPEPHRSSLPGVEAAHPTLTETILSDAIPAKPVQMKPARKAGKKDFCKIRRIPPLAKNN